MTRLLSRPVFAIGSVLLLIGALLATWAVWMKEAYDQASARIDRVEPRHARLAGLGAAGEALDAALAKALDLTSRLAYPASVDATQAGAALQKSMRELAEAAGATVTGSQLMQSREEDGYDVLRVSVKLTTSLESLSRFLAAVGEHDPRVQVATLRISPDPRLGRSESEHRLICDLALTAMRIGS
ncbi:MAG: hypothetical protein KDG52_05105 [Rhodocyclaceae bacterium]|nr:hypothetical protein [Rhodocyclaceae bacterium]